MRADSTVRPPSTGVALAGAVLEYAPVAVFGVLPFAGLLNGALYAPLLFGLGVILAGAGWASGVERPRADVPLLVLAALFAGLGWASVLWSVAPAQSIGRALNLCLILPGALLLLAAPAPAGAAAARLFPAMLTALALGGLVMAADRLLHYPLQHLIAGKAAFPATKYNRGLDYFSLLVWPMLACGAVPREKRVVLLALLLTLVLVLAGLSATALVALLVGAAGFATMRAAPHWAGLAAAFLVAAMAATLPLWLREAAAHRAVFAHSVKASGLHRLEIWDYMTARVSERPWHGWGLAAANAVPIRPAELQSYRFVVPQGVYPHQQWLELWLELGVPGVLLAVALVLLVLRRIAQLPPRSMQFGFAAFAAALAVSFSNFEITTDSWWAALAGTAFLIRTAARLEAA